MAVVAAEVRNRASRELHVPDIGDFKEAML